MKLQVPIEGSSVRRETTYPVVTENGYATVGATPPPITTETPEAEVATSPATPITPSTPPATPRRELTPLESFHPALANKDISFDEKTGRIRITPKVEETLEEVQDGDGAEGEVPALGEQHQTIPTGSEAAAATREVAQLREQIAQQGQIMQAMLIAQAQGKPLAEVLGLQPAQPSEPDLSQIDLYEPGQLAGFIKQTVQGAIQGAMQPHQQTIESARRRQEYEGVAAKHGTDPAFNNKVVAALELVKENPALTVEQGYDIVNRISQRVTPTVPQSTQATQAQVANGAKPATQTTARTLTPEQAAAKAEQAKKLPNSRGVNGAGPAPAPDHFGIGDLGKMMAWDLQHGSSR